MPYLPSFIAPTKYSNASAALAQVQLIYSQQIAHLRSAMQRYVVGETLPGHVRACDKAVAQLSTVNGFLRCTRYGFGVDAHKRIARPDMPRQRFADYVTLHGAAQVRNLLAVNQLHLCECC